MTLTITQGSTAFKLGSTFNGGDGTDTLVLQSTTTAIDATSGKMFTNFEVIKLIASSTYTAGSIAGITSYEIGTATIATLNDLASGTDVLISSRVWAKAVLNLKAPVLPSQSLEVTLNHGGPTATSGVYVTKLETNASTLVIESTGLLSAGGSNSIVIENTQAVKSVSIKGDSALSLTTGANEVSLIDGQAATAALTINATNASAVTAGGLYITTGSGADDISVNGNTANATFITAGLGADKINLAGNTKVDTLILTSQADSTATAFDKVTGFEAGAAKDVIDISAFNITNAALQSVGVGSKATVDFTGGSEPFTITAANAGSFFTNAGVQTGVVAVTDGTDSFAFIDVDGDGAWDAAHDSVILLTGVAGASLVNGNFHFGA